MSNTKLNLRCVFTKIKAVLINTLFFNLPTLLVNNELDFDFQIANEINNHKTFQIIFS
jgi:hypothetical protein